MVILLACVSLAADLRLTEAYGQTFDETDQFLTLSTLRFRSRCDVSGTKLHCVSVPDDHAPPVGSIVLLDANIGARKTYSLLQRCDSVEPLTSFRPTTFHRKTRSSKFAIDFLNSIGLSRLQVDDFSSAIVLSGVAVELQDSRELLVSASSISNDCIAGARQQLQQWKIIVARVHAKVIIEFEFHNDKYRSELISAARESKTRVASVDERGLKVSVALVENYIVAIKTHEAMPFLNLRPSLRK
ncbi:MAG: hypothetical protein KF750_00545 [Xanthobacteraceae bacterium]|nr:hypothetical protein [Xanthobacteraceae bacterium]